MRTILAICLLTATFAFIPSADAACDPTYTACTGSYNYGDCANGFAGNYASAFTPAGFVGAGTYCGGFSGYTYSGVYVYTYTPAGYNDLYWYGGTGYCYADSYNSVQGYTDLTGVVCTAGAPPGIPGTLP